MASIIIHMAIAKELENKLDIENKKDYYLGSIAPDIAKQIGLDRNISHFSNNNKKGIPDINLFVKRYPTFKYNSFNLGYFIHLYTDKIWQETIETKIFSEGSIKLLDGTVLNISENGIRDLLYSDYTNLNRDLIDKYNLDLSLFYEEFQIPDTPLNEIPIDKLDILINKMGIIIENSKKDHPYTMDIYTIKEFINNAKEVIDEELKKY